MPAIGRVVYVSHGWPPEASTFLVVIRVCAAGVTAVEKPRIFQTAVKDGRAHGDSKVYCRARGCGSTGSGALRRQAGRLQRPLTYA